MVLERVPATATWIRTLPGLASGGSMSLTASTLASSSTALLPSTVTSRSSRASDMLVPCTVTTPPGSTSAGSTRSSRGFAPCAAAGTAAPAASTAAATAAASLACQLHPIGFTSRSNLPPPPRGRGPPHQPRR